MNDTIIEMINLHEKISEISKTYFLEHKDSTSLYSFILEQIEPPLLEAVISFCQYNQKQAAKLLGIHPDTLRKKLIYYFGNKYCYKKMSGNNDE